jgi:hypothetical protein
MLHGAYIWHMLYAWRVGLLPGLHRESERLAGGGRHADWVQGRHNIPL